MAVSDIRPEDIPDFVPILPSLENISDLLSIIGAEANVSRVKADTFLERKDFFGFIGFGPVNSIFPCIPADEQCDFFPLDLKENGEISLGLLNITYPDAFDKETMGVPSLSKKEILRDAAFSQHFISGKEIKRKVDSIVPLVECFAIVFNEEGTFLLTRDGCYEETQFFEQNIWATNEQEQTMANFRLLLENSDFKERHGRLFAIVHDQKLSIKRKLDKLKEEYAEKYGCYDSDRTLSREDWASISALNATISEAASFELVIENSRGRRKSDRNTDHDASTSSEDERYSLFCKIRTTERELWAEQEKFKYSMLPGHDVFDARKEFFRKKTGTARSPKMFLRSLRTPLAAHTKHNLMDRNCLSTGGNQKSKRKGTPEMDKYATPKRQKRISHA